ncbi:MAG: gliding motility-associated C-terminal domain-containing protein [Bacteroidia bacterium]
MVLCFFIFNFYGYTQTTTYKISNTTVYDCRAKLTDSEGNTVDPKWYASNEDYIFTVCVTGASQINVTFSGSFDVESKADFLKIYNGKDTNASLLKKYDNASKPSGMVSSSDSCITFYFHSDKFVNGSGFELNWQAKITKVRQPVFSTIADPKCNSTAIRVILSQKFNCDSIKAKNFKLSGTLSTAITNASGVNCDSKNESNTFDITFGSGLNQSGNYVLDFNSTFKDACDSVWKINAKLNFKISDCPIKVNLITNKDTVCKGACANLTATVTGGNPANYTYTWLSGALTGKPPKTACPTTTTTYILQVSDGVSVPGTDTVIITVLDPPKAQNDTSVCQSSAAFNLSATPTGGSWTGTGITNAVNGTFDPFVSKNGTFNVTYKFGGCTDIVVVIVRAINAGPPNASCPGKSPFMVSNFSPAGGTWSGANITSAGLITPPAIAGSFTVTYSWNGCTANKIINIDGIAMKKMDTLCQSIAADTFKFTPKGGTWAGAGMTNTILGINSPYNAGGGNKLYVYSINGCRDTLKRHIQGVDARGDEIACPDAGQRTLPAGLPAGGFWSGKGIFDKVNGIFDADSFKVAGKSTFTSTNLTYTSPNGCKDVKIMYLRYTRFYTDTVRRCDTDTTFPLQYNFVQNDPWNTYFTGSSAILGTTVYTQKFSPKLAGKGTFHQIIGSANGCKDTLIIKIYPRAMVQKDTAFCIADDPFKLFNGEKKGTFSGKGITNVATGMFSPAIADTGLHKIIFSLPGKCVDTIRIRVNKLPVVFFSGLQPNYCLKDTIDNLNLSPLGGILTGKGITASSFNPKTAGSGNHNILYKFGTGKCVSQFSKLVYVTDTLKLNFTSNKDSVCVGTTVTFTAKATGGSNNYQTTWNSGQTDVQSIFVLATKSNLYTVVLKDGCSDSVVKQKALYVHPLMSSSSITSPKQCYGFPGFITLSMNGTGPYQYAWNTIPSQTTPTINAPAGNSYKASVTNTLTGCKYDTMVSIPGYSIIRAYFTYSPNGQCLNSHDATLQLINLSVGGVTGYWDFGDGTLIPYDATTNPSHLYDGLKETYFVKLKIANEGNCQDSLIQKICVKDNDAFVMPTAFSPNRDGINDVFRFETAAVSNSHLAIFNRWGEKMFDSDNYKDGWDGNFKNEPAPEGVYIYYFTYKAKKTANKIIKGTLFLKR